MNEIGKAFDKLVDENKDSAVSRLNLLTSQKSFLQEAQVLQCSNPQTYPQRLRRGVKKTVQNPMKKNIKIALIKRFPIADEYSIQPKVLIFLLPKNCVEPQKGHITWCGFSGLFSKDSCFINSSTGLIGS
jgi:hypothetical protein